MIDRPMLGWQFQQPGYNFVADIIPKNRSVLVGLGRDLLDYHFMQTIGGKFAGACRWWQHGPSATTNAGSL